MCCMHRLFRASSSAYLLINSEMLQRACAKGLGSYSAEMEEILLFVFIFILDLPQNSTREAAQRGRRSFPHTAGT